MLAFWSRSFFTFCFFAGTFAQSASQWRGWDEIDNIFVFGDSYTATGFEPNGTQPNPSNAFGNPAFPGRTFSNGRNWIDFLTLNYNDSYVSTYNFARGGASIDSFGSESIFRPFDHQVDRFFLPFYAENNVNLTTWRPDNTLFATFFGINDVNFFYKMDNRTEYAALISDTYTKYMEKLYRAGARNFLIMNVPPIHRAPFTVAEGDRNVARNKESVEDFNGRIMDMASGMIQKHEDIAVYLLDTYSLYNEVLDDPQSRTETTGYRNTTGSCPAYSRRTYNEDEESDDCGRPQREFFWLDALHPTPPIHRAMAAEIAAQLRGNEVLTADRSSSRPSRNGSSSRFSAISMSTWMCFAVGHLVVLWMGSAI